MMKKFKYCRGHNLIEVLIALLVLSIGLLGLAGLQATSMRYGHDANVRSLATIAANDIIERMHTNPNAAADYITAIATTACDNPATCCSATAATIENDLKCWLRSIKTALPGGSGVIEGPDTDGFYTVKVKWKDRETGAPITQNWVFTP